MNNDKQAVSKGEQQQTTDQYIAESDAEVLNWMLVDMPKESWLPCDRGNVG